MTQRLVIVNPWAGRGVAGQQCQRVERLLQAAGLTYDIVLTRVPGHATVLALQAVEHGYDQVVAVGGDGTLNEVVNGIMHSRGSRVALGIVPIGTGCDFVKSLDSFVHQGIEHAIHTLAHAQRRTIDIGSVTITDTTGAQSRHVVLNGLGMGIDACVGAQASRLKYLKGKTAYLVAVVYALALYKAYPMHVRFDTRELQRPFLVASVANGRCQGGGFWLTPAALLDDGMLDLCLIDTLRYDQIVRHFASLLNGTHTRLPFVTMGCAANVAVECAAPVLVAADGEVIATSATHIEITTQPQALDIIA